MSKLKKEIRDFVFRGLLFEADAKQFRDAGIDVGSDVRVTEQQLLRESLAPFGIQRRNDAIEMARLYAVLHAFENEIRSLIRDTLEEKFGADWWEKGIPINVKKNAEGRQKLAEKDSWLEGSKSDQLEFIDFGDLSRIIIENWDLFNDIVPAQEWIKQRMTELEKARNFVAHNRMLLPNEFQRIYMYISDWNKVIGL